MGYKHDNIVFQSGFVIYFEIVITKIENFQKYAYFVVNMFVPGLPAKYHLYLRGKRLDGGG